MKDRISFLLADEVTFGVEKTGETDISKFDFDSFYTSFHDF